MNTDPRAQWAELLHAPTDTTTEGAAAAFLRALPEGNFLPAAERVAAANALAGTSIPTGRDYDVERLLREEVEAFAANYWTLSPAERLTTWAELSRRGADAARLRELEPGLDVHVPPLSEPQAETLATLIRALFVIPPRARAIRRNEWLLERAKVETWRAALAVVQRDAPALAALEPRLRAALAPDFALAAFVEGASAAPVAVAPNPAVDGSAAFRVTPARSAPQSSGGWWSGGPTIGGGALFAIFIVIRLLSAIGGSGTSSSTIPPPRLSNYSVPSYNLPSGSDPSSRPPIHLVFTTAQVADFERYDREKAAGNFPQLPLGYSGWVLAGRPAGTIGAKQPTPERPSYSFDRGLIDACQDYERGETRVKPVLYDRWLAAGKPAFPGTYPLNTDP